ncbi:hypothetical protein MHYP_G00121040 [Metynnis hypsauchen]
MEQLCQLLEHLSKFTDTLASETRVTLSAIKHVLDHITHEVLVEKDEEPSLTKEMKRIMSEDLNNRYTEKAKTVIQMACFIGPRFKTSFLNVPKAATVDCCVQEALNREEEPQSIFTISTSTTSTPTVAPEGKGLAGLLRKITSTRRQKGEEDPVTDTPENSERRDQGLPVSAIHSSRRGSTSMVEGPCIRAASSCQGCQEAFVHPGNQRAIKETVQREWARSK